MLKNSREELIKIAYENPQLRKDLLPVIKKASIMQGLQDLYHYWAGMGGLEASAITMATLLASVFLGSIPEGGSVAISRPPEPPPLPPEAEGSKKETSEVAPLSDQVSNRIEKEIKDINRGIPEFGKSLKQAVNDNPKLAELEGWKLVEKTNFSADDKGVAGLIKILKAVKKNKGKNKESDEALQSVFDKNGGNIVKHINGIMKVLEGHNKEIKNP